MNLLRIVVIFVRFDSSVEELLESHQARVSNLTDSRVGSTSSCTVVCYSFFLSCFVIF